MKVSISANVLNHFSSKFAATALILASTAEQKGLKGSHGPIEGLMDGLPFFKNIKAEASKICSITKTEDEVTFEINDEYIKGSIDLSLNLYERLAAPVCETIRQVKNWSANVNSFNSEWEDNPESKEESTATGPTIVILEVERQKAAHAKAESFKTDEIVVKVKDEERSEPVYVIDLDRQVLLSPLTVTRISEDLPYELTFHAVRAICQVQVSPLYYDAKQFDLPLDVLNAVRTTYGIPPFFTKEQVDINVAEKDAADEEARKQAREKAKQEKEAAKAAAQAQQENNQPE